MDSSKNLAADAGDGGESTPLLSRNMIPSSMRSLASVASASTNTGGKLKSKAEKYAAIEAKYGKKLSFVNSPINWFKRLRDLYSWHLLAMVIVSNHILKGFVAGGGKGGMLGKPMEFLFAEYQLSWAEIQLYAAVAGSPWALKPLIGFLSDAFPLFGYKKMPYVILTTILSLVWVCAIGSTTHWSMPLMGLVMCLFFGFLHVATCDLLVEAKQSEEVKSVPSGGNEFFTFTWMGITVGQAAGIVTVGAIIQAVGPRWPYLIVLPLVALVLWPTCGNYLKEKRLPFLQLPAASIASARSNKSSGSGSPFSSRQAQQPLWHAHPELMYLTFLVSGAVISLNICVAVGMSVPALFCTALALSALVMTAFMVLLRPEIAKPILFDFLLCLTYINLEGAYFYFYTDPAESYHRGPHFTKFFYTAMMGLVTFAGVFVGFSTGEPLFKNRFTYQHIMRVTVVMRTFTLLAFVPFLHRGFVPERFDKPYVCFVLFFDAIICAWRWIPKQVLGAHLTPNGAEAVALALVAGTYNMALMLANYLGAGILYFADCQPKGNTGDDSQFSVLWKIQLGIAFLPLLTLPLINVLYPGSTQQETILKVEPASASYGSWWSNRKERKRREAEDGALLDAQ